MLHKKIAPVALLLLASCAAAPVAGPPQYYAQYQTKLMLDVAQRSVDSAFEPADDQTAFGLELDIRQPNARTGLEIGLFHSSEGKSKDVSGVGRVEYDGQMTEFSVGGRWYNEKAWANAHPYACAGASLLLPEWEERAPLGAKRNDSGWAIGPYLRVGSEWRIGEHVSLALDYRIVILSNVVHGIDLGDSPADANYQQLGLVLGWAF